MNYCVDAGWIKPVFATLEEASAVCWEIFDQTGEVLCIMETNRKVTHIYDKGAVQEK